MFIAHLNKKLKGFLGCRKKVLYCITLSWFRHIEIIIFIEEKLGVGNEVCYASHVLETSISIFFSI